MLGSPESIVEPTDAVNICVAATREAAPLPGELGFEFCETVGAVQDCKRAKAKSKLRNNNDEGLRELETLQLLTS